MTRKTVPERSGLPVVHTRDVFYAYDLRGLMTEARFGSLTGPGISNTYDGFGRLASSTNDVTGFPHELEYRYDKDGNRTAIQHSDEKWFTYRRDNLGRTTQIYEGDAASWDSNTLLLRFNYNNDATLQARIWGSGSLGATQSYQHDALGRLTRIGQSLSGTAHDIGLNFTLNPASQIAKQVRSNDLYAYTALASRDDDYAANGLNRYTAVDGTGFTYDANGNLTSDGSTTYTYDVENRLVIAGGAGSATLLYDPLGRLYRLSTTFHTNFAHDPGSGSGAGGDAVVAAYNSVDDVLNRYVHGDRPDSPLVRYTGEDLGWQNRDWLMADHQGSIIAIAGGDASLEAINAYDDYGKPGANNEGRFQYTGQMWIAELGGALCPGLYHYKARIYGPCLGRFLQVDPVGYEDQFNLYAYVGNDPVNLVDPSGREIVINGTKEYRRMVFEDLKRLARGGPTGKLLVKRLIESRRVIFVRHPSRSPNVRLRDENHAIRKDLSKASNTDVFYDPTDRTGGMDINGSTVRPPFVGLGHELGHAESNARGDDWIAPEPGRPGVTPAQERHAMQRDNEIRRENDLPDRTTHTPPIDCKPGPNQCAPK